MQFNLKSESNVRLRKRLIANAATYLSPEKLVRLPAEELGNEEVVAQAEQIKRDSLKTIFKPLGAKEDDQIGSALLKKTHKGEVQIANVLDSAASSSTMMSSNASSEFLPNNRSTINMTSNVIAGPALSVTKNHNSLEDLIKKMSGSEASPSKDIEAITPATSTDPLAAVLLSKDSTVNDAYDVGVDAHNYSDNEGQHSPFFSIESPEPDDKRDAIMDAEDKPSISGNPQKPKSSLSSTLEGGEALNDTDPSGIIWNGRVNMAQVGRFNGLCKQVCGPIVGGASAWEDVLSPSIVIDGRIPYASVNKYVQGRIASKNCAVVAIEITPDTEASSGANNGANNDSNNKNADGYSTLFEYFHTRERYAVIGQHYTSVKDMYIIPLAANEKVPDILLNLDGGCRIPVNSREHNRLYGLLVLSKEFIDRKQSLRSKKKRNNSANAGVQKQRVCVDANSRQINGALAALPALQPPMFPDNSVQQFIPQLGPALNLGIPTSFAQQVNQGIPAPNFGQMNSAGPMLNMVQMMGQGNFQPPTSDLSNLLSILLPNASAPPTNTQLNMNAVTSLLSSINSNNMGMGMPTQQFAVPPHNGYMFGGMSTNAPYQNTSSNNINAQHDPRRK